MSASFLCVNRYNIKAFIKMFVQFATYNKFYLCHFKVTLSHYNIISKNKKLLLKNSINRTNFKVYFDKK